MSNDTLAELFARDPFSYTKEDIDQIILYYRQARMAYNVSGKRETGKVNLDEMGLGDGSPKLTIDALKRSTK
jgi:hypothetical protein